MYPVIKYRFLYKIVFGIQISTYFDNVSVYLLMNNLNEKLVHALCFFSLLTVMEKPILAKETEGNKIIIDHHIPLCGLRKRICRLLFTYCTYY